MGGPRGDSLYGHTGSDDDEIYVSNAGQPDVIFCDGGFDWVEISLRRHERRDPLDRYVDCESVHVDRDGIPS
ncbi:hypothetical protein [Nocardioides antri]|uniref:Uncharacterized protein n=1 Tax=Nocardioides antri TaxID=2607659 RepID=A0A5B1M6D5_9ACTN|nr:hypothetical protein [Nocardioides antri]KAA1427689.1 hypothetical protein F0U47_09625 [Nocardioides antri]